MNGAKHPEFDRLVAYFTSLHISISPAWLAALLSHLSRDGGTTTATTTTSGTLLKTTCLHHFLASDIMHSIHSSSTGLSPESGTISGLLVEIVDCIEVGHAMTVQLTQLEEWEERQKPTSRRLYRTTMSTDDQEPDQSPNVAGSDDAAVVGKKMCRVTVQDHLGTRMTAIDAVSLPQVFLGMTVGSKMILNGVPVVHGVLVLSPAKIIWLGGRSIPVNHGDTQSRETTTTTTTTTVARIKHDLVTRLAVFPVMSTRDRQRAAVEQRQTDGFGDGDEVEEGRGDNGARQQARPGRGRASRGRGASTRARGRASRARGR